MSKQDGGTSKGLLRFGVLVSSQNLLLEIESMEKELTVWAASSTNKKLLKECRETLVRIKRAARTPWRIFRSYYIFTSLQWINQQLFQVRNPEQLRVHWLLLRDRLYRLGDAERGEWTRARLDRIENNVASDKEIKDAGKLRGQLFALRKLLDEKVALSLWQIRQTNTILASLVALLLILLVAVSYVIKDIEPTGGPLVISSPGKLAGAPGAIGNPVQFAVAESSLTPGGAAAPGVGLLAASEGGRSKSTLLLIQTILIASLGATLSSLLNLITGDERPIPPFINRYVINMARPLIGAVAGLFFYLLVFSGWLTIQPHPIAYFAFAFVFGFSERLFGKSIEAMANTAEAKITTYGASGEKSSKESRTSKSK